MTSRRWLLLIGQIAVSLLLLIAAFLRADLAKTAQLLLHSNLALLVLGLAFGVAGVVISSMQWGVLLRSEDIHLSLPTLTRLYFFGYVFNVVLPTTIGGDAIKATYLARLTKRSVPSVGATLMARVVGFGVLLATALVVSIGASVTASGFGWGLTVLLSALSLAYLVAIVLLTQGERLRQFRWLAQYSLGCWLIEAAQNLASFTRRRSILGAAVLLSLLFYGSLNLNYYVFGLAVGLHAGFWFYWVAVPILSVVTLLPISLNGYGLREATAIALFRLSGDSAAGALSLALLVELQLLLFALIGFAVQPRFAQRTGLSAS
jgi:uncharacterized protein (TIRG00374 family)